MDSSLQEAKGKFPFKVYYDRGFQLAGQLGIKRVPIKIFVENGVIRKSWGGATIDDKAVVGAQRLIKAKETTRASQWLLEARSQIRRADADADENSVRVALGVVSTYGKFDRVSAFEVLSETVRLMGKTNLSPRDEDQAPALKRFSGLEASPDFTYGTEGFSLKSAVNSFGPEQFEDVLGVVSRIKPAELQGLAIMELCRKYLKSTERTDPNASGRTPIQANTQPKQPY